MRTLGVVERLEHRLDVAGQVLGVHPVDGVGERAQHAELPAGREARAVLDVALLVAVVPVHARDQVLVGADAGGDRRRAHRASPTGTRPRSRRRRRPPRGSAPSPARGRRRSRARASRASSRRSRRGRASWAPVTATRLSAGFADPRTSARLRPRPANSSHSSSSSDDRARPAAAAPTAPPTSSAAHVGEQRQRRRRPRRPAARARARAAGGWPASPIAGADHAADPDPGQTA